MVIDRERPTDIVEGQINQYATTLEQILDSDLLTYYGPLIEGVDDLVIESVEHMRERENPRDKLTFIITTQGGYIGVVHRMVDSIRHHYSVVNFIVPNYAYSAGTILVMSGDAIYMDYYSRLGPIDPQVEKDNGEMVPALGYLVQWDRLLKKAQDQTITQAEIHLMQSDQFDQATLYKYEQERELSISLLQEWLVKYKFKNWNRTASRHKIVTPRMKTARAKRIAEELNNTQRWHVHGHGISMAVLRRDDINLIIDDFGTDTALNSAIKRYYNLFERHSKDLSVDVALHRIGEYHPLWLEE